MPAPHTPLRADATAWIHEETGLNPADRPTFGDPDWRMPTEAEQQVAAGRFTAFLEFDGRRGDRGPEWASLEDALEWAHARADRVVVRVCGPNFDALQYSAGATLLVWDTEPILPWPEGGLTLEPRRLGGWEYLDRTEADDPIDWDTRSVADMLSMPGSFGDAFLAALEADPSVTVLDSAIDPDAHAPSPALAAAGERRQTVIASGESFKIVLRLTARTHAEAIDAASRACAAAVDQARTAAGHGAAELLGDWTTHAYPTGSVPAQNARIETA